jgi:hypothetical protein
MAASKLTLSIDSELIEKAKGYASKHHTSVSKLFSDFVNQMTKSETKEDQLLLDKFAHVEIPEQIKAITGILKGKVPESFELKDAKYEYLKDKYGL